MSSPERTATRTCSVSLRRSAAPTRERAGRPSRARDRTESRAGRQVVAGRRHDQGVQLQRAVDGARLGRVGEGDVRLGQPDHRDARRVVRVAVPVRVDRGLEAGDQLVAASVDGPAAGDVPLPAGDAHGKIVAPGAIPRRPYGPP